MTRKAPPELPSAPTKPAGKPPIKVSASALATARTKPASATGGLSLARPQGLFTPYQPPPKIKPSMAMDQTSFETLTWANQGIFASAFQEGMAFFGYPELAILAQRAEFRRISEILATEMTRKWIKLQGVTQVEDESEEDAEQDDKTERIAELEEELERFNIKQHFRDMAEKDGWFGRAHLYVETEDGYKSKDKGELAKSIGPGDSKLSKAKVQKGSLRSFKPVEAVWCYPNQYNSSDPLDDHWYRPETWKVMSWDVHHTRLLTFVGREVPDLLKPAYAFGGLSMTQMAKPYVDNWLRARQSVSDLIYNFSTNILKTDLSILNQEQGEQSLFDRMDFFNAVKNNRGLMALDKETEEYMNVSVPLGGLDALQAQAQEQMAAVSGIPIVKLMGIQPSGLNASSEGEIRTFYDWIGAFQEKFFRPHLQTVIWFIMLNLWGEVDKDIKFEFVPLWEMTPKEKAEIRQIDANTGALLIQDGSLDPSEERERFASDPDTPYKNIDIEDMPEPTDEEKADLEPHAEGGGGEEEGEGFEEAKPGKAAAAAPQGKAA